MGSKILFASLFVCIVAAAAIPAFLPDDKMWWIYVALGAALLLLLLLLRNVVMPKQTVMRGIELIASQDFNNRLAKVGERDADKIVELFNDMIDRLRNERLYNREQDSFLRLLIDASPMGVAMLDFDDKVSMANEAFLRITGIGNAADVLGKSIGELPTDLAGGMAEVPVRECRIIRRGDVRMYRCYHLSFVKTGFNRRFYLLESLTEEVMKAERNAYEKVIRIISHEVNNTMGGVRSVLETLLDISTDEEIREVIESCDNRCSEMCGFISSYADVVRVPEPVIRREDLNEEIRGLLPFLHEMIRTGVSLEFDNRTEKLYADIDKTLVQQVIVNIVKNASESFEKEEGGRIVIQTYAGASGPVVVISNDGMPISEAVSRQLFSPFFTTKKEGKGLGLTLISEILNRHGATFSLRTDSDGITRFRIEL